MADAHPVIVADPVAANPNAPILEDQTDLPHVVATDIPAHGTTTAPAEHIGPTFLGMAPGGWVGVAMLAFIIILIWKGVFRSIAGVLDTKIVSIREQLDEARQLRVEAEALREEYIAKIASAEKDAEAMIAHAQSEAEAIVAGAEIESEALVARRQRMAEDKIAAAERAAIKELRAKTAAAAAAAARRLISERYEAEADRRLVDQAIAQL